MDANPGNDAVRFIAVLLPVWLSMSCWFAGLSFRIAQRADLYAGCWLTGSLLMVIHIAGSYGVVHQWSHAAPRFGPDLAAVEDARDTGQPMIVARSVALSVIVPCFNEEDGIANLRDRLLAWAQSADARFEWEVLFVDAGSTDTTAEKLREMRTMRTTIRHLRLMLRIVSTRWVTGNLQDFGISPVASQHYPLRFSRSPPIKRRMGTRFCHASSSGSAALHTAFAAIDPEPGDEFITTPITDMGGLTPIL